MTRRPDKARRNILKKSAAVSTASLLGGLSSTLVFGVDDKKASLTPECSESDATISQTAGPFYTPSTPLRHNFREPDFPGRALQLTGRVVNQYCEPIPGSVLDFWHADAEGVYDNQGYRFRGHLFTDQAGRFSLDSILPGIYPGRTRHIHVILQGERTRPLTTQLYFPNERFNARDFGYDYRLELKQGNGSGNYYFDFVLQENV